MNIHHLVPSVSRRLLSMGSLMLAAGLQPVHASGVDLSKFRRIEPQFIAALGDPGATSGNGAQSWGFWSQDPGPRGCKLDRYPQLKATGVAPAQWKFDAADWWLEEHGLIMEKPTFPLAAWEIPRHGRPQGDDRADNSPQGQERQSAVGTRRRRDPLRCHPSRMPLRTLHAGDGYTTRARPRTLGPRVFR